MPPIGQLPVMFAEPLHLYLRIPMDEHMSDPAAAPAVTPDPAPAAALPAALPAPAAGSDEEREHGEHREGSVPAPNCAAETVPDHLAPPPGWLSRPGFRPAARF